jgi:hypothetical protein
MVIWGLKDNDSWRNASNPLLYDAGLGKKPAFYAVRSALRHRAIVKEQSAIESIRSVATPVSRPVCDLLGRHVDPQALQPGIYIKDGKKFFVR